jgi:hypothetical protein
MTPSVFYRYGQWWAQVLLDPYLVTGIGATREDALRELEREIKRLPQ